MLDTQCRETMSSLQLCCSFGPSHEWIRFSNVFTTQQSPPIRSSFVSALQEWDFRQCLSQKFLRKPPGANTRAGEGQRTTLVVHVVFLQSSMIHKWTPFGRPHRYMCSDMYTYAIIALACRFLSSMTAPWTRRYCSSVLTFLGPPRAR